MIANGQVGFMGPPSAKVNPTYAEVHYSSIFVIRLLVFDRYVQGQPSTLKYMISSMTATKPRMKN